MRNNVILSGHVFWVFSFCKFRRDLSSFTDTMAAEGICERKNTYWLCAIGYLLYAGLITSKSLHVIS